MGRPNRSREAILRAAVELAARRGISATSMDDIAQHAGVAKGSLYYNFASKDELFKALFAQVHEGLVPCLETAVADASDGAQAVESLVSVLLERLQQHPAQAKLLFSELFRADRNWAAAVTSMRDSIVTLFDRALRAARPDLYAADASLLVATSLLGAVLAASFEWIAFESERELADVVASVTSLVLPSVRA